MSLKEEFLRRYSNLPSLLNILIEKKLTLLNPDNWDDKNDSFFINQYKSKKKLKTVLALCTTTGGGETFHHWKVFADGSSGICIIFKKNVLLDDLKNSNPSITLISKNVKYRTFVSMNNNRLKIDDLPFTKRAQYKDENEFRIIYENKKTLLNIIQLEFTLSSIQKIVTNPSIPLPLHKTIESLINGLPHCQNIKIEKTTLISSEKWKNFGINAMK